MHDDNGSTTTNEGIRNPSTPQNNGRTLLSRETPYAVSPYPGPFHRHISYQSSRATAVLVPSAAVDCEPEAAARTGVSCGTLEATGTDVGCSMEAAAGACIVSERPQRKAALSAAQRRQREQAFAAILTEHGGQVLSLNHRNTGLHGYTATVACTGREEVKKSATAKVDEPDTWNIRAGLNENVVQLDVPVEDPSGVDFNESIHQLFCYGLLETERDVETEISCKQRKRMN
ncbi:hypothetical protein EYF80_012844 [Liparis tanakae]|uniref:Uncharacterized protein n=1 Tax=Liparis tanakae TaxID=230148 RepID=A0A4Z2IGG7_9TELE|nr:hypothetical protein EYF80_012844 [Liparis tanakae]